jgi:hypothetical protein
MEDFLVHRSLPDSLYRYGIVHMIALGDQWRSAHGEPRDNDQLDDCYSILKLGTTNFSFPDVLSDMRIRQCAIHANFREFHYKTLAGLFVFGDPERAETVERATRRALRDCRAPIPSGSRECYYLKDLEQVQQTHRQKWKFPPIRWFNRSLRKEEKEDAKRGTTSVPQATDTEKDSLPCRSGLYS